MSEINVVIIHRRQTDRSLFLELNEASQLAGNDADELSLNDSTAPLYGYTCTPSSNSSDVY